MIDPLHVTWRELEYALENNWITLDTVIDVAIQRASLTDCPSDCVDLAGKVGSQWAQARESLRRLANIEPDMDRRKWLYLYLRWLYQHRSDFAEPFLIVDELYAAFDYPEDMRGFVRYMPPLDPRHVGTEFMLQEWRNFLEREGRKYAAPDTA